MKRKNSFFEKKNFFRFVSIILGVIFTVMTLEINSLDAQAAEENKATGIVASNSTQSLLLLNTSGGQMKIKLDSGTDFSECRVLVGGQTVTVTYYRGNDAYLHASKVSDGTGSSSSSSANSTSGQTSSYPSVSGTIAANSTSSMIYFNTSSGQMQIKIDDKTDASQCRLVKSGLSAKVYYYRGSDAYLHAAKIVADSSTDAWKASVSTANTLTVSGTVGSSSTPDVLYLSTSSGLMQIRMDRTVSITTKVVTPGQKVTAVIGYGSDAYWHAVSISPEKGTVPSATMNDSTTQVTVNGTTLPVVSGTAASNSTSSLLYLNTKSGQMQIKLDASTDGSEARTIVTGNKYYVAYYRGSDAYLHAGKISAAAATNSDQSINSNVTIDVNGTVASQTDVNVLYLNTVSGQMKIRMENSTSFPNGIIHSGDAVHVTCGYGADATWHALKVTK